MKISYYDLLNAIRKGNAPKRISIYGHEYTWDGADYEWKGRRLADALREWTPLAQAKVDFIEVDEIVGCRGYWIGVADGYADNRLAWVPIELQVPKPFEKVLLTTKDGNVIVGTYDTNMGEYIAWMPLPEPYEVKEE